MDPGFVAARAFLTEQALLHQGNRQSNLTCLLHKLSRVIDFFSDMTSPLFFENVVGILPALRVTMSTKKAFSPESVATGFS
jgi:hypothetical protein